MAQGTDDGKCTSPSTLFMSPYYILWCSAEYITEETAWQAVKPI